jgi:hypothetical protein
MPASAAPRLAAPRALALFLLLLRAADDAPAFLGVPLAEPLKALLLTADAA